MLKRSTTESVNMDQVKYDSKYNRVMKYAHNPKFFIDAVGRFGHYTNPVAYKSKGKCCVISQYGSLGANLELEQDEILLDIIDINQNEVMEFLLSFQYHEHKETRSLAEFIKITLEHVSSSEGKMWLKTITQSDDKEEQLSQLFGITKHAAKCYLKLIQPGNEKYLDMLAEDKNYRLSTAYADCIAEEKQPKPTKDTALAKGKGKKPGGTKCTAPGKSKPSGSSTDTTTDPVQSDASTGDETTDQPTSSEPTPDQDGSNEEEFLDHLEKYKKEEADDDEDASDEKFAQKVLVILSDGKPLELDGDIQLKVDGQIITNTGQLHQQPNGDWALPIGFGNVSLTLVLEDFFADF